MNEFLTMFFADECSKDDVVRALLMNGYTVKVGFEKSGEEIKGYIVCYKK